MLAVTASDVSDAGLALVARRRAPRMYVVDRQGEVLFAGPGEPVLGSGTGAVVAHLIAQHAGDEALLALCDDGQLIRLIALDGKSRPHYAVFVETVVTRSPLDDAAERYALTSREKDVLRELLRGSSTAEIAGRLIIAECTVASHVRNIGAKMNASKRKEILAAVLGTR